MGFFAGTDDACLSGCQYLLSAESWFPGDSASRTVPLWCSGGEVLSHGQSGTSPADKPQGDPAARQDVPAEPAPRPWAPISRGGGYRTRSLLDEGCLHPRAAMGIERQRCPSRYMPLAPQFRDARGALPSFQPTTPRDARQPNRCDAQAWPTRRGAPPANAYSSRKCRELGQFLERGALEHRKGAPPVGGAPHVAQSLVAAVSVGRSVETGTRCDGHRRGTWKPTAAVTVLRRPARPSSPAPSAHFTIPRDGQDLLSVIATTHSFIAECLGADAGGDDI